MGRSAKWSSHTSNVLLWCIVCWRRQWNCAACTSWLNQTHCPAGRTSWSPPPLCKYFLTLSLRYTHDQDCQSKSDSITIPSFLPVYSQLEHSLDVSFQISKVALNIISWKCSIRSPARRDIVNTHFQVTLGISDLKEEWYAEANRAVTGFSRDGGSRDTEALPNKSLIKGSNEQHLV